MREESDYSTKTDEELINEARSHHGLIYVYGCYSRSDLGRLDAAIAELERRGYEVFTIPTLVVQHPKKDMNLIPAPYHEEPKTLEIVTFVRQVLESNDLDSRTKDVVLTMFKTLSDL